MKKYLFVFGFCLGLCAGNGLVAMGRDGDDFDLQVALQAISMLEEREEQEAQFERDMKTAMRNSLQDYEEQYLGKKKPELTIPEKGLENSDSCMLCGYTGEEYSQETTQKLIWVRIGCGHIMCNECFDKLKKSDPCPFCRKQIEVQQVNRCNSYEDAINWKKDQDDDESVNVMALGLKKMFKGRK